MKTLFADTTNRRMNPRAIVYLLLLYACMLSSLRTHALASPLGHIQEERFRAQIYLQQEKYDSAAIALASVIKNDTLCTPYDCLNYALCHCQRKDTTAFLKYLDRSIEGGVDSVKIKSFLRKLAAADQSFLLTYLDSHYEPLRQKGWQRYDTVLIKEANAIAYLDQFVRNELMRLSPTDPNYQHLLFLQRQADSINYTHVASLLASGRFPGYRNCGAFASLTIALMHLGDYQEAQWAYLFVQLKAAALTGNILPVEVASIADNHYQRGKQQLCSYYGQWTGRTSTLCDCNKVDQYRAEIGLPALGIEYHAKNKPLPECYAPGRK